MSAGEHVALSPILFHVDPRRTPSCDRRPVGAGRQARRPVQPRCWGRSQSDSRKIEPGDVFWALRGPNHDGEDFLADAFRRGAAGAVVARDVAVPDHHWVIRVEDTQRALWAWARWKRRQFYRHRDRRDRQRRQDHRAADDPHRAAIAAPRHGQPAKLQQLFTACP